MKTEDIHASDPIEHGIFTLTTITYISIGDLQGLYTQSHDTIRQSILLNKFILSFDSVDLQMDRNGDYNHSVIVAGAECVNTLTLKNVRIRTMASRNYPNERIINPLHAFGLKWDVLAITSPDKIPLSQFLKRRHPQ